MSKRNPFMDPYANVLSRLCKLSRRKKTVPLDQAVIRQYCDAKFNEKE